MNKAERAAFAKVATLVNNESERRAGSFPASHEYMREVSRAADGLVALETAIQRHRALAAKWKAQRKAKR